MREAASHLGSRIVAWLNAQTERRPAQIGEKEWAYAVQYAQGCYGAGIERYRRVFEELRWSGKRHGLEVGSGSGHWSLAFALDNRQATGIDRCEEFLLLANGAAREIGLNERVRYQFGRAEALDFPDEHFDVAWSHSVLQYCDVEDSISETARVLEPGGQFYCGYSGKGFRLLGIYHGVAECRHDTLLAQLHNYVGASLGAYGLARPPWSGMSAASADQFAAVCRAYGLSIVSRPDLQDARRDFAGIPTTLDFLCVRDGDPRIFRKQLTELSAGDETGRRRLCELMRLGLGKLVYSVLRDRGEPVDDPEARSLRAWAGLRAAGAEAVAPLMQRGVDPFVTGLFAVDHRRFAEAVAAFRELPTDHPDRSFLLGAALIGAGERGAAVIEFERGGAAGHRPLECEIGAMLARVDVADWSAQRERMTRVLRLMPASVGASPEKVDEMAARLAPHR